MSLGWDHGRAEKLTGQRELQRPFCSLLPLAHVWHHDAWRVVDVQVRLGVDADRTRELAGVAWLRGYSECLAYRVSSVLIGRRDV
jgi:hypothetical protein